MEGNQVSSWQNGSRQNVPVTKQLATKQQLRNGGDETAAMKRRWQKGVYPQKNRGKYIIQLANDAKPFSLCTPEEWLSLYLSQ